MHARRPLVFGPVLLILLFSAASPSRAGIGRWTPAGPDTGSVRALAVAPSRPTTLYTVVGLNKVYRSTDRGSTWTPAGTVEEEGFQGISDVAVDAGSPQRVYALGFWQVFRSNDGGASWRPVLPALGAETRPDALVLHPRIRGLIYVFLTNGDLLRSADGGRRWTRSSTPAVAGALVADPSSANVLYFGSFLGRLYKSINGGATWSLSDRGLNPVGSIQALAVDPSSPRTLYLVPASDSPDRSLFISRNGGESWSPIPSELDGGNVRSLAVEPGRRPALHLTLNGRPFRSFDDGRSWTEAALSMPVQDLLPTPFGLLAGTAAGIYRSTDRGASWARSSRGLQALSVESLAMDFLHPHLYAVGNGFLFKSPDGGASWNLLQTPSGVAGPVATAPTRRSSVFAGTFGTVLRSVNGGRQWAVGEEIDCALPTSLAVDPTRDWVVYLGIELFEVPCGDGCRTFKSIDTGATWACIAEGLPNGGGSLVVADPRRSGVLYAEALGRLYRSEDDGLSWSLLVVGLNPLALAISPADPQVLFAGVGNGVGRSEDGGRTWRFDTDGLPEDVVFALATDPVDARTVYAAALEHGVFKSTDGGATWTTLGPGLEGLRVTSLLIDRQDRATVYAGTGADGVWVLTQ
ncbi:MAG TPA: hypothetical protein VE685_15610 [Thermoanaerobaculia bacterium]|nr:hypothetical protein [Thermoanaerobaculia bacterium]